MSLGFYINLPIGAVIALPLLVLNVPRQNVKDHSRDSRRDMDFFRHEMDVPGFLILTPCAVMLLLALQLGGNHDPWTSPTVLGLFAGAVAALPIFIWVEYRQGDHALLPLAMVGRRIVWCSCLVMMFSIATTLCTSYFLPIYFQAVRGASPVMSGVYLLPNILTQLSGAIVAGLLG